MFCKIVIVAVLVATLEARRNEEGREVSADGKILTLNHDGNEELVMRNEEGREVGADGQILTLNNDGAEDTGESGGRDPRVPPSPSIKEPSSFAALASAASDFAAGSSGDAGGPSDDSRDAGAIQAIGEALLEKEASEENENEQTEKGESEEEVIASPRIDIPKNLVEVGGHGVFLDIDKDCQNGVKMMSDSEGQNLFDLYLRNLNPKTPDVETKPRLDNLFKSYVDWSKDNENITLIDGSNLTFPGDSGQGVQYLKGIELDDGKCLVFCGDTLDSAGWKNEDRQFSLRFTLTLVYLKLKYPSRVILILGNRDANKLRLKTELDMSNQPSDIGAWYWQAGQDDIPSSMEIKYKSSGLEDLQMDERLKELLPSFGATASIDNWQLELTAMEKSEASIGQFIKTSVETGVMSMYLELAYVLGAASYKDGDDQKYAVFLHGSLHPLMFKDGKLHFPGTEYDVDTMKYTGVGLPLDFSKKREERDPLDQHNKEMMENDDKLWDVKLWVEKWAAWKKGIFEEWQIPSSQHKGGKCADVPQLAACRPGATLMDMATGTRGGTWRNAGFWKATPICEFRYSQNPLMLDLNYLISQDPDADAPETFASKLSQTFKISRMFTGHFTESGRLLPEIFRAKSEGVDFMSVNLDTTLGSPYVVNLPFTDSTKYPFVVGKDPVPVEAKVDVTMTKDGKVQLDAWLPLGRGGKEIHFDIGHDTTDKGSKLWRGPGEQMRQTGEEALFESSVLIAGPMEVNPKDKEQDRSNWFAPAGGQLWDPKKMTNNPKYGNYVVAHGCPAKSDEFPTCPELIKVVPQMTAPGFPPGAAWYFCGGVQVLPDTPEAKKSRTCGSKLASEAAGSSPSDAADAGSEEVDENPPEGGDAADAGSEKVDENPPLEGGSSS